MAGKSKRFNFHGSFGTKSKAVEKEQATPGAFIVERMIGGKKRWFVLTEKR